ncbi:putative proliferating cell nuclear antigen [Organic Lake phycodnavirus 1]|jgi:proliferating cell nuclear antigen|nr:putative proliferating cell nuclear antigen [Organic Lake phycodnavirus 1]
MPNEILLIQTVQIAPFRILITALKDILLETNITFQKDGMRIVNMDKSHTILVHLHLHSEHFERFICNKDKIIIGVNMSHFFKLINTIDNEETLSIYIDEEDYNSGIVENLTLKFENKTKEQYKIQKLKLIEPDNEDLDIPQVKFSSIINLPSSDFQKIIRDLNVISEKLEIKSINNRLIFKCVGTFASAEIIRSESEEMSMVKKSDKIIQGFYSLKNLNYFIKCTNLCNQIEIYLDNDLPLIIKYNVASLGEIKLGLSPIPG